VSCEEEYLRLGTFNTPSNHKMMSALKKYDSHMSGFAQQLNDILRISNKPLWVDSPKEFFQDHDKSVAFFEKAIKILKRKDKLEKLKSKIK
jgi:hypothetical protein